MNYFDAARVKTKEMHTLLVAKKGGQPRHVLRQTRHRDRVRSEGVYLEPQVIHGSLLRLLTIWEKTPRPPRPQVILSEDACDNPAARLRAKKNPRRKRG